MDDGSTDGTLAAMIKEFDLEPRQVFYRSSLETKPVRMVYRSRTRPAAHRRVEGEWRQGGRAQLRHQLRALPLSVLRGRRHDVHAGRGAQGDDDDLARSGADRRCGELLRDQPHAGDGRRVELRRHDERSSARRLPAPRHDARVRGLPRGVEQAGVHDVRVGRLRHVAARRRDRGGRVLAEVHLRGHRDDLPRARAHAAHRSSRTASSRCRTSLPRRRDRRRSRSSSASARAGSG